MTESDDRKEKAGTEEGDALPPEHEVAELDDAPALRALLKRSLLVDDDVAPEPKKNAELLASVQRKLRKRSRGKFYGDGWSTASTRFNYVLIAMVMLVTILAVYVALGPTGFSLH